MIIMTDWVDFAVYAIFLIALYFVQPAMQRRMFEPMLIDRNAEWVAAHPDAVRKMAARRWPFWLSYALGAASLAVLAGAQLGLLAPPIMRNGAALPKWMWLWSLAMDAMFVAILVGAPIGIVSHFAFKRLVPVATRRQATLERRSLDTSVPRWIQLATYALVLISLAAWVVAGVLGTHTSHIFWARLAIIFFLSGFFFMMTRAMVARRTNAMDRIFGPGYRPWEVRMAFATQILPPIVGAMRLYEEVTGTQLFDVTRVVQLLLAAFIAYWMIRVSILPIDQSGAEAGHLAPTIKPA
jgi:hypothetical protein